MATYHTVDGQPYSVTAGTDVTVTDADGLVLGVSAGGQGSFVGNGGDVEITGDHHFVQMKGGGGGGGGGGGEPFDGYLDADLNIGTAGGPVRRIFVNGVQLFGESTVVVDAVEANNANAVTSNAVWNALQEVSIPVDPAPTEGSGNAVSSGGVYTALRELPAPVPEPLTPTTAMRNGGVYTVTASGTSLDFSNVELATYAAAEVWIDCSALTNVTWPGTWSWVDGVVPPCAAGNRYIVRVKSDGVAVIAELKYSYANA